MLTLSVSTPMRSTSRPTGRLWRGGPWRHEAASDPFGTRPAIRTRNLVNTGAADTPSRSTRGLAAVEPSIRTSGVRAEPVQPVMRLSTAAVARTAERRRGEGPRLSARCAGHPGPAGRAPAGRAPARRAPARRALANSGPLVRASAAPTAAPDPAVARVPAVGPRPDVGPVRLALRLDDLVRAVRVLGVDHPDVARACKGVHSDRG